MFLLMYSHFAYETVKRLLFRLWFRSFVSLLINSSRFTNVFLMFTDDLLIFVNIRGNIEYILEEILGEYYEEKRKEKRKIY